MPTFRAIVMSHDNAQQLIKSSPDGRHLACHVLNDGKPSVQITDMELRGSTTHVLPTTPISLSWENALTLCAAYDVPSRRPTLIRVDRRAP